MAHRPWVVSVRCNGRFVRGALTAAFVIALDAAVGSGARSVGYADDAGSSGPTRTALAATPAVPRPDVGLAGPLGPQKLAAVPSYFKRVTFANSELGSYQAITAHLPAGKYLLLIVTKDAAAARSSDCLGVSFPLARSVDRMGSTPAGLDEVAFRGFVSVAADGDPAAVLCHQEAADTHAGASYELYYFRTKPLA